MPRNFSNWLHGYMQYTATSESPDAFHFWTGVSTIAGALRRQVWIDERHFQWVPNFYIILVGPPGVAAKSTTLRSGMKLLDKLKIPFGPTSLTWQALTKSLEDSLTTVKYFDRAGEEQKLVMCALTCAVAELGTFLKMDDPALSDVIVSLYDGQLETWQHSTKTTGNVTIQNPWLNIIGCTTPSWLENNFPEHMVGGGLTSRIIFVFGDKKRQLVPYPSDLVSTEAYRAMEEKLLFDLMEISTMKGEYLIDIAARQWGRDWYERHWTSRPEHMASDRYGGYIARKQAHIHKLSMVLAAAKRSKLVIEKDDLVEAEQLISSLEPDMQRVFTSIGLVDAARQTNEIVTYVRHYREIATQALWKLCMPVMDIKTFKSNISAAIQANMIRAEQRGTASVLIYVQAKGEAPTKAPSAEAVPSFLDTIL